MHVASFLRLASIVTALLGAALLLFPVPILTFFAGGQVPNDVHFVRFLGTALLGFGVLNWASSNLKDASVLLPSLYGNAASLMLGIAVDAVGIAYGTLNQRGWWILLLHLGFGAGFSYYIMMVRRTQKMSGRTSNISIDQPKKLA